MGLLDQVKPPEYTPTADGPLPAVPPAPPAQAPTPASAAPPVQAEAPAPAAEGSPQFKSKVVDAVPPDMRDDFTKLVLAGMKILYDKGMQPEVQKALSGNKPIWQKLGEGVAKLMTILDTQSQKTAPKELLIPAGIELVHEYGSFLQESGQVKVTPDDIQQGSAYAAVTIAKLYGAPDQQVQGLFKQGQQPAATPTAPAAPTTPPQMTPQTPAPAALLQPPRGVKNGL